jgi:hypothetical protein
MEQAARIMIIKIHRFIQVYILYMTLKAYTIIGIIILLVPNVYVYAGGAREDWSDKYDNLPGAPECWMDGYDDGLNHPFDGDRHRECIFDVEKSDNELCCNGKPYYEAFIYGCMSVEGNSKEDCERNIE